MTLLTKDLFKHILLDPIRTGGRRIRILSGYASPAMAIFHMKEAKDVLAACGHPKDAISIDLIVGMVAKDGISRQDHEAYQKLMADNPGAFSCSYVPKLDDLIPIHSKVYCWDSDMSCFVGSANYSQNAFSKDEETRKPDRQGNVAAVVGRQEAEGYIAEIARDALPCTSSDIESFIKVAVKTKKVKDDAQIVANGRIEVPLLTKSGDVGKRSGLNWGNRPEEGRNPDQAYIPLPASCRVGDFWPAIARPFIIYTDDGKVIDAARAQDGGKAIHSYRNNTIIGSYFRERLGIPSGQPVTLADLLRYGRTSVVFTKIDDERFLMDFSKPKP